MMQRVRISMQLYDTIKAAALNNFDPSGSVQIGHEMEISVSDEVLAALEELFPATLVEEALRKLFDLPTSIN